MKSKGTYKKGMGLSQVIKEAKKSWKSHKRGGAESDSSSDEEEVKPIDVPDMPEASSGEGGRRRRRSSRKQTRRHRRR